MSKTSIKVLIVDDEVPARERLGRLVDELEGWSVCGSCGTGREAIALTARLAPEVVLLDIRMPGMTGIEVARHLDTLESPPAVVFTTAYDQYALEAFDSRAVGYLLKPVRRERLASALTHAARLTTRALRDLAGDGALSGQRRYIAIRTREDLKLIPVEEVQFFRAEQKYVTVHHKAGADLLEESLRGLADELDSSFVRIHRSLLVALAHIESLERSGNGTYEVLIRGSGERLPVSRRHASELKTRLSAGR